MKAVNNTNRGFTLVETLLYMAILGTILTALFSFASVSYQARIKSQTVAEVEQQGNQIMDIILQSIRSASLINTPTAQNSGASLSINTYSGSTTPTVFDISGGNLRITEGVNTPINLTGGRVTISGLTFTNTSELNAPGSVRVQFNLKYNNNSTANEYDYNETFYGTASLRWP